jgi:hypothetical protein
MDGYDEEAVRALQKVREVAASLRLPLLQQRRYNGILNAMEMQIEDGGPSKEVLSHLRSALLALARFDGLGSSERALKEAFDQFEAEMASRYGREKQLKSLLATWLR